MAGRGGIGEGDLAYRLPLAKVEGEAGALELKDDLRDEDSIGGGGNMNAGVLLTDVAGVNGPLSLPWLDADGWGSSDVSNADSMSLAVDGRRNILGRPDPCALGVREWL